MITSRRWLRAATALIGLSAVLIPAAAPASASAATTVPAVRAPLAAHRALPEPPPADGARGELGELNVDAPHSMAGYSRAKFPHWARQYGECDTRVICTAGSGHSREASGRAAM